MWRPGDSKPKKKKRKETERKTPPSPAQKEVVSLDEGFSLRAMRTAEQALPTSASASSSSVVKAKVLSATTTTMKFMGRKREAADRARQLKAEKTASHRQQWVRRDVGGDADGAPRGLMVIRDTSSNFVHGGNSCVSGRGSYGGFNSNVQSLNAELKRADAQAQVEADAEVGAVSAEEMTNRFATYCGKRTGQGEAEGRGSGKRKSRGGRREEDGK